MYRSLTKFLLRWFVSGLGLWIAASFVGGHIDYDNQLNVIIFAGLMLAAVNTVIKPILIIFALPAILFTLGLFMIIINGLTVLIAAKLYGPLEITNFWAAVFAGMVIGLVNYLVTTVLEDVRK